MTPEDERIDATMVHMERVVNAGLIERVHKLEQDVQTLLIGFTLLSLTLFFLTRELYMTPDTGGAK